MARNATGVFKRALARASADDGGVNRRHVRLEVQPRCVRRLTPLALVRLEPEVHRRHVLNEVSRVGESRIAVAAGVRL